MKRLLTVSLAALLTAHAVFPFNREQSQTGREPKFTLITEIILERSFDMCLDCPNDSYKVIIQRGGSDIHKEVTVTYYNTKTKEQRQGNLSAYYYNNLIKLIEAQGYFEMKDGYALDWEDSLKVNLSITKEGKRKTVRTSHEGEVPIQLWGIYMAIDGVLAKSKWKDGKPPPPQR